MDKQKYKWLNRRLISIAEGFKDTDLVYLNELGWRSNNQSMWPDPIEESIVLIGCSQTFAGTLPYENTIGHYLEQQCGRQVINLGWPGSSNHWMWKMLVDIQTHSKPWAIVVNWTSPIRYYEWHTGRMGFITFEKAYRDEQLHKFFVSNPDYLEAMNDYIIQGSRLICEGNRYVDFTWSDAHQSIDDLHYIKTIDRVSDDDYHWGPQTNKVASNYINDRLKDQAKAQSQYTKN